MIYICIPVFNRIGYTRKCLRSIYEQSYKEFSVIICDDGSTDGTGDILASEFPEVTVLKGTGDLWWSGGTNKCVEYALRTAGNDDYIFTLNNDTELTGDTLNILVDFAGRNPKSIVSCGNYFNNERQKLEATAFVKKNRWPFSLYHKLLFPWGQNAGDLKKKVFEVDSVSGKGVLIPAEVFRKVGLYNAEKLPQYHGDTEFTRRAVKAGYRIFINLDAVIYTDQSASGIGQVNSKVSIREFIHSFSSKRSENYLPSLYYRSRLIYGLKWPVYLLFNIFSIKARFIKRYVLFLKST